MKTETPFRKAVAAVAGAVIAFTGSSYTASAADTTTTTAATTASTAEGTAASASGTDTTAVETTSEAEEQEEQQIEWYKATLDDYDDSLSLISYEASPESGSSGTKKKSKKATPVELNVTGGYVGDIPFFESEPEIESTPGKFAIVTYGWGHGVGMSQNGANFYATYSDWTYQDILFHYYPDTYLMDTCVDEDDEITVNGVKGDVLSMVSQIVFNEVGGSMSYEAIKAQAVAVYTYCMYHNGDGADLRCKPHPPQVVVDAVSDVLGQALFYNDDYALTMFSASSGGITANCYEVFWADLPYLRSVSSDYDACYDPHYGTVTYVDDFQLRNMIEKAYNIKLSDEPAMWIQPEYSDETGYVTYVNIDDQLTVKGYEFKLALNLKSSKFNVFYTPRPEGEAIPHGSSEIEVVDADYQYTPGVVYPNNHPTNIGDPKEPEETTEETTDTTEETTEDMSEGMSEPTSETPTAAEISTETASEAPVGVTTDIPQNTDTVSSTLQ
ncbi:MAG: sporulation protein [Ruminococcus sp.]|nr:sporulation protein [Ruminococcus sp.]